ncbi:hypothetical protein MNBD_UNCLBAC01-320 [hydrothermal vent metagenome]|uniref:Uncharacterized protein n=1 Tax=hydrothermal vent metagenome TaxID=652676 RepID=A0A3B1DV33_9ZZZZ
MDLSEIWNKALSHTEIIRARVQALLTIGDTHVPYVLLSESSINIGDTVVRKGKVLVEKPTLVLPPNNPQFSGFDFNQQENLDPSSMLNFLMIRGIALPSMRYDNKTSSLDIYEGKLSKAITHYEDKFQQQENVSTGLIAGPEDCWQFSLLIFVCSQIARNAETDIKKLMDEHKRQNGFDNSW